jgi:hypothetical protein
VRTVIIRPLERRDEEWRDAEFAAVRCTLGFSPEASAEAILDGGGLPTREVLVEVQDVPHSGIRAAKGRRVAIFINISDTKNPRIDQSTMRKWLT